MFWLLHDTVPRQHQGLTVIVGDQMEVVLAAPGSDLARVHLLVVRPQHRQPPAYSPWPLPIDICNAILCISSASSSSCRGCGWFHAASHAGSPLGLLLCLLHLLADAVSSHLQGIPLRPAACTCRSKTWANQEK